MKAVDRLFVSLSLTDPDSFVRNLRCLTPHVGGFVVGQSLLAAMGPTAALDIVRHHTNGRRCVFIDANCYAAPDDLCTVVTILARHPVTRFISVVHAVGMPGLQVAAQYQREAPALVTTAPAWLNDTDLASVYGGDSSSSRREPRHDPFGFTLGIMHAAREAGCGGAIVPAEHLASAHMSTCFKNFMLLVPDAVAPWNERANDENVPHALVSSGAGVIVIPDSDLLDGSRRTSSAVGAIISDIERALAA